MNKKQLKEKIKDLPASAGIAGLALLLSLAEGSTAALSEILEGPRRRMRRSLEKIKGTGNFWNYYDELKNAKENSLRTTLWRLEQKGLVEKEQKNKYQLTPKGLKIVKNFQAKEIKEEVWDGKWRLIMFDIPEKKRHSRDWLRWQLVVWDYKPLQKSVFIGKYPIEKELYSEFVGRGLKQFIRLMTIGDIDNEDLLNF